MNNSDSVTQVGRVLNWCLYILALLTPVLFVPLTFEVREFNKQALLFLLVAICLGMWIIKILVSKSFTWTKNRFDFLVLAYLVIYLASSFLSVDHASSFL